ncbi:MAG: lysophospholipid acyltransferase family protein [Bacteroidota bacterium]
MENTKLPPSGKDTFSYAQPRDPRLKRWVIRTLERLTGSKPLQRIYRELYTETPNPYDVWENAFRKLNITVDYDGSRLDKVPRNGPVIFIANHPFGVVDGAILLHLVTRVRRDYFLLINSVLADEPLMKGHLLPVDFDATPAAKATNLRTREETTRRLKNGEALAIFPSGAVATAFKWRGPVEEFPWRRFICGKIHETQCTVIPIYFHGANSRLFQTVSKVSMNMRLGLLLHEIMNKRNTTIQVAIGNPIPYVDMQPYRNRQELIEYLYERTMGLKNQAS